jgi:hypothetical protein
MRDRISMCIVLGYLTKTPILLVKPEAIFGVHDSLNNFNLWESSRPASVV